MERSDGARREDGLYDRIGRLERLSRKKDERIKELERSSLEHLKGHSLEAICDECSSHYWYVDDETIVCPYCHPEQALKGK